MPHDEEIDGSDTPDTEVPEEVEKVETPPNRYNVSSYGWDSDVEGLVKRVKRRDIYVPPFQRGFVWNRPEQSRFIESLILGLPVPNIFLAQDSKTKSLNIVDGQQRLLSLIEYMDGRFSLTGDAIQEDLKGRYFSTEVAKAKSSKVLTDSDARALSDSVLHAIVIKPDPGHDDQTRGHDYNQAVIQIFRRLNTAGKPLVAQEIRTSIFYGPLDALLRELNENADWRALFGKPHSRFKDMELILRFVALRDEHDQYKAPMPRFLDAYMEKHRDLEPEKVSEIRESFVRVVRLVKATIGASGLRSGRTLTVSRFDAVMTGFDVYCKAHPTPSEGEVMVLLKRLDDDEDYQWSIDEFVNDTDRVKKRIARAIAIFGA